RRGVEHQRIRTGERRRAGVLREARDATTEAVRPGPDVFQLIPLRAVLAVVAEPQREQATATEAEQAEAAAGLVRVVPLAGVVTRRACRGATQEWLEGYGSQLERAVIGNATLAT